MKSRHRAVAAALVATLCGLRPSAAVAAERGCPGMSIEPDAGFRARFPDVLARIQGEFSGRVDVDACARVDLQLEGDRVITLAVTLPDGRAASRSVTRPDDVIPTLQALLLVPDEVAPTAAAVATPAPTRSTPRRKAYLDPASRSDRDVPPRAAAERHIGVELSAITGARWGDGQLSVGAGALSFLELYHWLIGFEGRVDSYRSIGESDPETALELAILAGRRFDLGSVALDLSAGPAVAMKGIAVSRTEVARVSGTGPPAMPPPQRTDPSSGPVPRLLLGARLGFSPRSVFRTFVGLDAELGPARVADDAGPSSARLPEFSLGLALGATVGTP